MIVPIETWVCVDPMNVICQNPIEPALCGRRIVLCAVGGVSELAALNSTLTPLGRFADAGNTTVAPLIPADTGSVTVAGAVAESVCVTVVAGVGVADGVGVGVAVAPGAGVADLDGAGVVPDEPPQPAIDAESTTNRASPKRVPQCNSMTRY